MNPEALRRRRNPWVPYLFMYLSLTASMQPTFSKGAVQSWLSTCLAGKSRKPLVNLLCSQVEKTPYM